jgi:hypothetical protein
MSSRQDPGFVDKLSDSDMEEFFDFDKYYDGEDIVHEKFARYTANTLEVEQAVFDPTTEVPTANDPAALDLGMVPHTQTQPCRAHAPQLPDPPQGGSG